MEIILDCFCFYLLVFHGCQLRTQQNLIPLFHMNLDLPYKGINRKSESCFKSFYIDVVDISVASVQYASGLSTEACFPCTIIKQLWAKQFLWFVRLKIIK